MQPVGYSAAEQNRGGPRPRRVTHPPEKFVVSGMSKTDPDRALELSLDGMTSEEMHQAVIDGCSAGMGLEAICLATPGMPSVAEIRASYPEVGQWYLEEKRRWEPVRRAQAAAMASMAEVRAALGEVVDGKTG